jgi:hypothetical protein
LNNLPVRKRKTSCLSARPSGHPQKCKNPSLARDSPGTPTPKNKKLFIGGPGESLELNIAEALHRDLAPISHPIKKVNPSQPNTPPFEIRSSAEIVKTYPQQLPKQTPKGSVLHIKHHNTMRFSLHRLAKQVSRTTKHREQDFH